MTAVGGASLVGGGIEQKGKRTHGHGQQYSDFWLIKELNGNGKKYNKD